MSNLGVGREHKRARTGLDNNRVGGIYVNEFGINFYKHHQIMTH